MVQVIPRTPGLGELLGGGLGQGFSAGAGTVIEAKMKELIKQQHMKSLSEFFKVGQQDQSTLSNQPVPTQGTVPSQDISGQAPIQQGSTGGMTQPQEAPFRLPYNQNQISMAEMAGEHDLAGSWRDANKQALEERKFQYMQQAPLEKEKAKLAGKKAGMDLMRTGHLKTVNEMLKLVPYTGSTGAGGFFSDPLHPFSGSWQATPHGINRHGLEMREKFNTMGITLEGLFRDLTAKGNMPKAIFEALLKRLPDASLSERENKGRLEAIKEILTNPESAYAILGMKEEDSESKETEGNSLEDIWK